MNTPEDQNGLREALARAEAERDAAVAKAARCQEDASRWFNSSQYWEYIHGEKQKRLDRTLAERDADRASLRAAEAEITRLKENTRAAVDPG